MAASRTVSETFSVKQ